MLDNREAWLNCLAFVSQENSSVLLSLVFMWSWLSLPLLCLCGPSSLQWWRGSGVAQVLLGGWHLKVLNFPSGFILFTYVLQSTFCHHNCICYNFLLWIYLDSLSGALPEVSIFFFLLKGFFWRVFPHLKCKNVKPLEVNCNLWYWGT